jgi:hypothetical protein
MPTPFKLRLENTRTGEVAELAGAIDDAHWKILKRFTEFAAELDEAQYVKLQMPLRFAITWNHETGFEKPTDLPPAQQVREFLHLLRPFLLEDEPTNFLKVCNIFAKYFDHPLFRQNLKELRRSFQGKRSQSYFTISSDDLVLNSEEALKLWLNAFEYHRDEHKRERLNAVHQAMPLEISKALFIDLLRYKVEAIWWVAAFIKRIETAPTNQAYIAGQQAD